MSTIRKLKIQKRRISGIILQTAIAKIPETIQGMISPKIKDNTEIVFGENDKIVDGYWIILQD